MNKVNLSTIMQKRVFGNSLSCSVTNRYTPINNVIQMIKVNLCGVEHWGKFVLVEPWMTQGILFSCSQFTDKEKIYEFLWQLPLDSRGCCTIGAYLNQLGLTVSVVTVENEIKLIAFPNDIGFKAEGTPVEDYISDVTKQKYDEYIAQHPELTAQEINNDNTI